MSMISQQYSKLRQLDYNTKHTSQFFKPVLNSPMVDGTTTAATTTTTTSMLGTSTYTTHTNHINPTNMSGDLYDDHILNEHSQSPEETTSLGCPGLVDHSTYSEDSDDGPVMRRSEGSKLRLPSGRTIARKSNGPHTSKHRHRRTPSPSTTAQTPLSRKLHGNCAMIPDSSSVRISRTTQKPKFTPTPPTSDSEVELEDATVPEHTTAIAHRICEPAHRITIRASDAQMLATLPVSTQRTLLATSRKAVERAGRAEQEYRGKLDGYGNLKSKERFVNDVPGGRSHRNRFFAQ